MNRCFKRSALHVAVAALAFQSALADVGRSQPSAGAAADHETSNRSNQREARKAIRGGNYEKAARIFEGLLALHPNDINLRLGASLSYLKLSDYKRCFDAASEVLKSDRSNARAHALAGISLLRSGYVNAASAELETAVNLDPKEALAYGGAAEVDYYEGRVAESRRKSVYAHKLDPDEPDYLITYARASSRAEDFNEAAAAYELFLRIAPDSDHERRDRIRGLISFYRRLAGVDVNRVGGADSVELPFHLGVDRRPYVEVRLNGRTARFVVDTGSGFTVLSKEAAKRFGVPEIARGGKSQGVGGTGKFPIVYGLIRSIEIGGATVRMAPCFIRPFHGDADRAPDERADGFIGLSILSRYLTELDYKENKFRLTRGAASMLPAAGPGVTVVPFRTTQNGLISVETEINENPINVILDSGASSIVLSAVAVDRLKLHDQIIKGERRNVIGAAGVTGDVEMLFVRNCKVADIERRDLQALVMDLNAINETSGFEQSGILGGNFLCHFRVTIDFSRARLALTATQPPPPEP